jgi:hypothetical protein
VFRTLALVLTLAVGLGVAALASRTPAPVPAGASTAVFSAGRAFADIQVMGAEPHPTGSPANARVRDHLLGRMRALGLDPRIQRDEALYQPPGEGAGEAWVSGARVENLIGVLPGRDRHLPALAVMAHYDSVPGSPGAADDAAGVASALETARALKATGGPARDVVFVLTDGEEAGLIGARAFFDDDPLAKRIGAVINLDTRGGGGRTYMFETGQGNGATIARFAKAVPNATSNSLAVFLYAHMPNGTDFTLPKDRGLPGLNFAFIGLPFDYHAASSTPAHLEPGALQHMGQQLLAATRDLSGPEPLPARTPDAVYSDVLGLGVIAYPAWDGWIVLAAAAGLIAVALARVEPLSWTGALRGAGAALALTFAVVPLADLARRVTGAGVSFVGQRPLLAQFPLFETALALLALALVLAAAWGLARGRGRFTFAGLVLLAAGVCCLFGGIDAPALVFGVLAALASALSFGRPVEAWSGWVGVLAVGVVIATALQIAAPILAFVFTWPLLAAGLAAAAIALGRRGRLDSGWGLGVGVVVGGLALGQIGYAAHAIVLGVGAELPGAIAPLVLTGAMVVFPAARVFADQRRAWMAPAGLLVAGLGLAHLLAFLPWASARTPRASEVLYVISRPDGRYLRVSPLGRLDPWSRAVLVADGGAVRSESLPILSAAKMQIASAKAIPLPPRERSIGIDEQGCPATSFGWKESNGENGAHFFEQDPAKPIEEGSRFANAELTRAWPPTPKQIPKYVEFLVCTNQIASQLRIDIRTTAQVANVTIDGKPARILTRPGEWSHIIWTAPAAEGAAFQPRGVSLTFAPQAHGKLESRWMEVIPGWPTGAKPLAPRPSSLMPWSVSELNGDPGFRGGAEGRFRRNTLLIVMQIRSNDE